MATPDIHMSGQVRQILGPEMISNVLATPLREAHCPACQKLVPPMGPVNVVVGLSDGGRFKQITFAHHGCAPSSVVYGDAPGLPAVQGMNMTALLLPHGAALLPALVGERNLRAYKHGEYAASELTDVSVADSLGRGLTLIARLREAPRRLLDWPAIVTDGPGPSHLLIRPADLFYDGDVTLPPGWRPAVEQHGWCVLYSGSDLSEPDTGAVTVRTLRAAAAAGKLVGARLRLTWAATR